jgi:hypothetical protein
MYCTLNDMNMGLSTRLTFLNNRAIVNDGRTIGLHNNKKVQTGKGSQKRNAHFYYVYVVGAHQSVPIVATKQDFYQAIWDAPEQSNCSLKRTAPPQASKKVYTPATKKAKASSARAVSPQSVVPPSPPKLFNAANIMVQKVLKVAFPSLRFPVKLIGVFPALPPEIYTKSHQLGHAN